MGWVIKKSSYFTNMKYWLETNPSWLWFLIVVGIFVISGITGNPVEIISWAALFLGASGFVNSLWLNKRINRMEDVFYEKRIAKLGDFVVPKKPSHLDE